MGKIVDNALFFNFGFDSIFKSCFMACMIFLGMFFGGVFEQFINRGPKYMANFCSVVMIVGLCIALHPDTIVKYGGSFLFGAGFAGLENFAKIILNGVSSQKLQGF